VRKLSTALAAVAAAAAMSCCGSTNPRPAKNGAEGETAAKAEAEPAEKAELHLYAFGRVLGTVAPCGCTTEPLGGLQYALGYLDADAHGDARVIVEPGSFLFPDPKGPEWPTSDATWAQAGRRADTLADRFAGLGDDLVSGLGPVDAKSPEGVAAISAHSLPRVLTNLDAPAQGLAPPAKERWVEATDAGITVKIAVTAVVDPAAPGADALGKLGDPVAALNAAMPKLREAGADITVALVHGTRTFTENLAREVDGLDIAVVGLQESLERARLGGPAGQVEGTWVLEPGEQLQTVSHLRLVLDPASVTAGKVPPATEWTVVPSKATREDEIARVQARLEKFEKDPSADPAFIERLRGEVATLKAGLDEMPEGAAVVELEQVKITCKLPVHEPAKQDLKAYNDWVSAQNQELFANAVAPPPAKGEASYVGTAECDGCHEEAVAFWRTTVHAGAYETLVETNQQFDLSCVSCHVTGFRKPGGSEVVKNEGLRDVQCETCHGPGSLHVEEPEKGGKAHAIVLDSPESVCAECHTPEHSDTFAYEAYLRDVLGEGHAPKRREALGDGPTGRELRAAGLAKAGGACKKM
jgi:hypothetical protein